MPNHVPPTVILLSTVHTACFVLSVMESKKSPCIALALCRMEGYGRKKSSRILTMYGCMYAGVGGTVYIYIESGLFLVVLPSQVTILNPPTTMMRMLILCTQRFSSYSNRS